MLFRVFAWLVADAQFDRVQVELFGKFVHRAFKRHQPDELARRAHRRCNRNIQRCQAMSRQPVGTGVQRAGLQRRGLIGLLAGQIAREHIMADREDSTVPISTQAEALDGIRAVRRDVKDLLPCQCGFHRAA